MAQIHAPIRHQVDICFVGGSSAAVAAAASAAAAGASVLLLTERPYLGEDLTATFRLRCTPGDAPRSDLARTLFGADGSQRPTPMAAKTAFDQHLIDAGVDFLYGCYPAAALRDADGGIAGVVMASRSGLFAVRAKLVVDATARGSFARLAGQAFTPYPAGTQVFERVVVGGEPRRGAGISTTTDDEVVTVETRQGERSYPIHRMRLEIPMADGSIDSFAAAEFRAGAMSFHPGQHRVSDALWQLPPDAIAAGDAHVEAWSDDASLGAFRGSDPALYVIGPLGDLSRAAAADLARPATSLAFGQRVGTELAARAAKRTLPAVAGSSHAAAQPIPAGTLRTQQDDLRGGDAPTVAVDADRAPLLGEVDVLVMGGGTAGAPAGIAAGRHGATTLVCEYQPVLGGVGTVGMIASYYFGNRVGFTTEVDHGTRGMGPRLDAPKPEHQWNIEWKQRWYQMASELSGTELWFGSIGCGAVVEDGFVRGVLVATPHGIGVVRCKAVVDGSGSADVAAHAGAETEAIEATHVAIQGTGLGPRTPGHQYRNTDWTFIDDNDVVDTTHAMVAARRKYPDEFDLSTLVDSRERRRIIGDVSVSPLDQLAGRTWPDTIVTANSNFDTHGMTIHPIFMVKPMDKKALDAHVPFRCLLPKSLKNVACTGLGKCAHRDALPVIRMQPDVQNEGYAAGTAAAMAARADGDLRAIDLAALQQHLVEVKILAEEIPEHADSFPLPESALDEAIADGTDSYLGLATIFADAEASLPKLRAAYAAADGELKLRYAQILGLLGDATGAADLAAAIADQSWDEGWNYRGMGQYGRCMSPLDDLIVALGRCGDASHAGVVIDKIRALTPEQAMSHSRAVAEACEQIPIPEAAEALASFLRQPGISGHQHHSLSDAIADANHDHCDTETRNVSLRELHLARALYRIGDHECLGAEILANYAKDLRAVFARHAQAVLKQGATVSTAAV